METRIKFSYRLENRASSACISYHYNATLENLAFFRLGFLYVEPTFGLSENLLSNGYSRTHPQLFDVSFLKNPRNNTHKSTPTQSRVHAAYERRKLTR